MEDESPDQARHSASLFDRFMDTVHGGARCDCIITGSFLLNGRSVTPVNKMITILGSVVAAAADYELGCVQNSS